MNIRLSIRHTEPPNEAMEKRSIERGTPMVGDLRKRPRLREAAIQSFLFLCGFLSILITFGIIYELGKESLLFFGQTQWSSTNKPLAAAISADQTVIEVGTQGTPLQEGTQYRIEEEIVFLQSIDGEMITLQRGVQGSQAAPHSGGLTLQAALQPDLVEFFTKATDHSATWHIGC